MKITIFLLIPFILLVAFIMANKGQYYPSKGEQLVNSISAETAKIIEKKYNIRPCGVGAAMPGGPIQELTLCFNTKFMYTKEKLRELLIMSAQEFLRQVNENNDIQKFLKERPFTTRNIQIIIYNHDKDGREVFYPNISGAQIAQNVLTFRTVEESDTFSFKDQFQESYEEALNALSKP